MRAAYLSFRIAGTDGVSLEANHWKNILTRLGHEVTFVAGELDGDGIVIPELHFAHPKALAIHRKLIEKKRPFEEVEGEIADLAEVIESKLRTVFENHKFDRMIVANVFSLPIHLSFSPALEKIIDEFRIPTIARDHDFWWDRERYKSSAGVGYFAQYFPPKDPFIRHTTLNSLSQQHLKDAAGINAAVVADSFDFSNVEGSDWYAKCFRNDFGLTSKDIVFLQATRIVPRKNIEASIELVRKLDDPRIILVLAGYAGDEGREYLSQLKSLARQAGIRAKFIGDRVDVERRMVKGVRYYSLWDVFKNADFVTYPTKFEGFGNQFLETIAYKKPMMVNRYEVFKADLEPLGFDVIKMDGALTNDVVGQVRDLLMDQDRISKMAEKNFEIGREHFSYEATAERMMKLGLISDVAVTGKHLVTADLVSLFDPQFSD